MSETKYGFINGVAIEAGEGKEIIPESEARLLHGERNNHIEYYEHATRPPKWCKAQHASWLDCILAFRRPAALKEAGVGSLEQDRRTLRHDDDCQCDRCKISQLRTLAKDQSEALEKAETVIVDLMTYGKPAGCWESICQSCKASVNFGEVVHTPDCAAQEALTLIAKLKVKEAV